jgi:hypothetical protein
MNFVSGSVRRLLRFEGAVAVAASLVFYRYEHASWMLFAVLFLAPDLAMLGYPAGSRVGAAAYNLVHNYVLPLLLLMAAVSTARPAAAVYALIWVAHIGFDRMLGYGLKYPSGFGETHLGRIGKLKAAESMTS